MEEKIQCRNCGQHYSARFNHCPHCGADKWFKPVQKEINKQREPAPPLHEPGTLSGDLAEIDDMLITTALDTTQRNILRMRWIIVALLLLLNITALTAYLDKKKKRARVMPFNQAVAYLEKNKPAKAQQVIQQMPEGPDKTFLNALTAFKRRKYKTCHRLLARLPGDNYFSPYVHAMKGYVLFRNKQYAKAHKHFEQAYRLMPGMKHLKSNLNKAKLFLLH